MKKLILAALLSLPFVTAARAEEGKMADDHMQQGSEKMAEGATKPDAGHAKAKKPAKKKSNAMKNDSMKQGDGMKHDDAMGGGEMGTGNH